MNKRSKVSTATLLVFSLFISRWQQYVLYLLTYILKKQQASDEDLTFTDTKLDDRGTCESNYFTYEMQASGFWTGAERS
jgi:hypothetical protein